MRKVIINDEDKKSRIENNFYGSTEFKLSRHEIEQLEQGKCLVTEINSEYAIFITFKDKTEKKSNKMIIEINI